VSEYSPETRAEPSLIHGCKLTFSWGALTDDRELIIQVAWVWISDVFCGG